MLVVDCVLYEYGLYNFTDFIDCFWFSKRRARDARREVANVCHIPVNSTDLSSTLLISDPIFIIAVY